LIESDDDPPDSDSCSDREISRSPVHHTGENADLNWSLLDCPKFTPIAKPIPEPQLFERREYEDLALDDAARLITPSFRAGLPVDNLSMCSSSTIELNVDYLDRQFVEMGGVLSDSEASGCMMSDMEKSKRKPIVDRFPRKSPSPSPRRRQSVVRFAELSAPTWEQRRQRGSETMRRGSFRDGNGDKPAGRGRIRSLIASDCL
jgi:hypothetical protein